MRLNVGVLHAKKFFCPLNPLLEEDGFLLLYKRLDTGAFNWSRSKEEALAITPEQYAMLMQGLEIVARHPIEQTEDSKKLF